MNDAICDRVLEHLATILEQVQGVCADMIDMKARLQRVELAVADLEQDVGLPPLKWSSLRYGFVPDGGREDGKEEAHGGGDRRQVAAG